MWKNIEKDTTEIVYDNKNLLITELEDTRPVFISRVATKLQSDYVLAKGERVGGRAYISLSCRF
jgi:hypothetical protein